MAFGDILRRGFWLSLVLPAGATLSFYWHQPWLFVACAVGILPVVDAVVGPESRSTVGPAETSQGAVIPAMFIVGWLIALTFAAADARRAGLINLIGFTVGSGLLSGMSMAHSHELMHRRDSASRNFAELAFIIAGYPHYRIGHHLHHANVGNPAFGSTALPGQSLWSHLAKSLCATMTACIRYERRRKGRMLINNLTRNAIGSAVLFLAACAWGGWREALFCLGYFIVCVFVVESIGYLQHYGLNKTDNSPMNAIAWDMEYWISNRMFVSNGRHTDHHKNQTKNYSRLMPGSATLPGGYFHMLWVALVPKLWFSLMDKRLAFVRGADTSDDA
jgi:alkane 1-monooxygenase